MTTDVIIEAHCGENGAVKVTQTRAPVVYLRDGEKHVTHVFGDTIVRVMEIRLDEVPAGGLAPDGGDDGDPALANAESDPNQPAGDASQQNDANKEAASAQQETPAQS